MADISKITVNSTAYDVKDKYAMEYPYLRSLMSKTYTNVIATANDNNGAGFFYLKLRGTTYNTIWYLKTRVKATVPTNELYNTDTVFEIWGYANVIGGYSCVNHILSTSYRPIYYNSVFLVSATGYNNDCGNWIGINLVSSTNQTSSSYKRTIEVDVLDYSGCSVEMQDTLITPTNIPNRSAHTNWYTSTNTSFSNYDACNQGLKQSGDSNTTTINYLHRGAGNFIADSAIYRYQLLFHVDADRLTPMNNNDNVIGTTKTILTERTFDPFGDIYYFYSSGSVGANAGIGGSICYFSFSGIDLRYSFNITTTSFTAQKDLYLAVSPQSDGSVKLASASPLVQDLPTTATGLWYIYLGRTQSGYQLSLYTEHPVFMHDGTSIKRVFPQNAVVTASTAGLMSSADKTKLDGIAAGATANVGTITGITMNGASKGTSGVVNLGTVLTAHQDISGKVSGPSSATANHIATFSDTTGKVIKDSGYTIATSVPSGAKFTDTDTKNTAGSTDTSSKIFLIGATSQAANPQTYSHDTAYVGTDGCLYSGGTKVLTAHQDISGKVSGPSSATANRIATFSDTTGKVIKDSGYTIATSVPSGAKFTDTVPTYTYDSTNQKLTISY